MKPLSVILIVIGAITIIYSMELNTTVTVDKSHFDQKYGLSYSLPEKVNNIGLMNDKQNKIIIGGIILIAGLILFIGTGIKKNEDITEVGNVEEDTTSSSSPVS